MDRIVVVCLFMGLVGCNNRASAPDSPLPDPGPSAKKALELLDADANGLLSASEIESSPGLKVAASRIDVDGDGYVSSDELEAHLESYHEAGVFMSRLYGTQVSLDGAPLEGATVTLVPEEFMQGGIKPAKGVSDANGYCDIAAEGFNYSGVQIGLYRVEVSLADATGRELIPARYNTETKIGIEVSRAAEHEQEGGIVFELDSR